MRSNKERPLCLALLALMLAVPLVLCGCAEQAEEITGLEYISSFEGGNLYRADKIYVAQLHGDYEEMGRQYGGLLKDQIQGFSQEINETILGSPDFPSDRLMPLVEMLFNRSPERFKKIFEGMSQTSGLELDELMVIDAAVPLGTLVEESYGNCSVVAAWGEYTGGAPLVFGRNFDYPAFYKEYDDTLALVVFNPTDGSLPTAIYCNAGQVSTIQAFNQAGLVMATDEGSASGTPGMPLDRANYQTNTTQWFLDFDNLDALGTQISGSRQLYPILAAIADEEGAVSYECDLDDYRKAPPTADGLVVQTNHYVDPSWGRSIPTDPSWTTVQRYENLVALANQDKGEIDSDRMMQIMDTPIDQGGAFRPEETITQFVYEPADFALWLQAPGYQNWVQVPLGNLFISPVE